MIRSAVNKLGIMSLKTHKRDWEELASLDPMWAILSNREKRGNRWGTEEFFATGESEIDSLMGEVGPFSERRERALDFGCGLGRLTRALLGYYREAHGVDISEVMINKARELTPRCEFHINNSEDLSLFPSGYFDLVYTNRVLQHLPSGTMISHYLREFFRVVAPGGLVVFQVPFRKSIRNLFNMKRTLYHLLKALGVSSKTIFGGLELHPMRMTAVSSDRVLSVVQESGGELLKQRPDNSAHFAVFYCCRRLPAGGERRMTA